MKNILKAAAVLAVLAATAQQAQAQASSNVTATATVAAALTASTTQNLAFGTVIPGYNKTVTAANGGIVLFTGGAGAEVTVSFTALPANLTSGANTLPISYTAGTTTTSGGALTSFTPASGTTTTLHATTGELYVHVGGTVSPAGAQAAGAYTGTITVQAAYTGN